MKWSDDDASPVWNMQSWFSPHNIEIGTELHTVLLEKVLHGIRISNWFFLMKKRRFFKLKIDKSILRKIKLWAYTIPFYLFSNESMNKVISRRENPKNQNSFVSGWYSRPLWWYRLFDFLCLLSFFIFFSSLFYWSIDKIHHIQTYIWFIMWN